MILILTQSGRTGKNRLIAEDCATIINHFSSIEPDIKNFDEVSNDALKGYDKIVMIVPEWNRSIPFTLKQMIDNAEWPSLLKNKDIYLIGTSGGIGGNMFNLYKRLGDMKLQVKNLIKLNNEEISTCNEYLKDLPEDISDINELEVMIGNNKDLSRAYDLGKTEALQMINEQLEKIKNC